MKPQKENSKSIGDTIGTQELHSRAIALADVAFIKRFKKKETEARQLFKEAFELEKQAAFLAKKEKIGEPTVSILFKSAASLAINCGQFGDAEKLLYVALSENPSIEIKEDIYTILIDLQEHFDVDILFFAEPILDPVNKRYSLYPIEYTDIWKYYQEIKQDIPNLDIDGDINDWKTKLNDDERFFVKQILISLSFQNNDVCENLAKYYREVQYLEAKSIYALYFRNLSNYNEFYTSFISNILTPEDFSFSAQRNGFMEAKLQKVTARSKIESFSERFIALVTIHLIFYSSSLCGLFWLQKRGIMPCLTKWNELHTNELERYWDFSIFLYKNHLVKKVPSRKVVDFIIAAVEIEKEFVEKALPVRLIGMNADLMCQYIECVTDRLLVEFGSAKYYNSSNPFDYMEYISMKSRTNFFEKRTAEYRKGRKDNPNNEDSEGYEFALDADF